MVWDKICFIMSHKFKNITWLQLGQQLTSDISSCRLNVLTTPASTKFSSLFYYIFSIDFMPANSLQKPHVVSINKFFLFSKPFFWGEGGFTCYSRHHFMSPGGIIEMVASKNSWEWRWRGGEEEKECRSDIMMGRRGKKRKKTRKRKRRGNFGHRQNQ